ncbi:tRNA (adenosine(37)-N6)-threonylcarbamoyltransferase complex dimerization subunit type 1 TsaB [Candidatus Phytoplasma fraxini]|uniref:tRNA threonylcarbamoyladenosine complex dimerization subunit type 1 n=1 Tax=Ash yellows phytoplasma TaxID=35780 RepID=A0ABZ2U8X3_ASHYP
MELSRAKKYIILDISANVQIVILSTKDTIISIKKKTFKQDFVSGMIPLISEILNENKLILKDVSGIIVGSGPGSYIGSRLAVLTSKILALELNIPLYQISSLLLLSSGYEYKILTPKIYAKKNFFYSLSLDNNKIVLSENIYAQDFLNNFDNNILLDESNFKISLEKIFFYMKKVLNPSVLIPTYYTHY